MIWGKILDISIDARTVKTFGLLGRNEYLACEKDMNFGGPGVGCYAEWCPLPICMMVFGDGDFGR